MRMCICVCELQDGFDDGDDDDGNDDGSDDDDLGQRLFPKGQVTTQIKVVPLLFLCVSHRRTDRRMDGRKSREITRPLAK